MREGKMLWKLVMVRCTPSPRSNLEHMALTHSFFIPDVGFLQDLEGFLTYLQEKVYIANICLKCNGKGKGFHSAAAVQRHMDDKGHTQIPYETEEDMEEFDEFYDYSSALSRPMLARLTKRAKAEAAGESIAEGDEEEGDDDEQSYDESEEGSDDDGEDEIPRVTLAATGGQLLV